MGYRWKPSASQRKAYHEKCMAIEAEKKIPVQDINPEYLYNCTGDCCKSDEITFFNPAKSSERLYGIIINESYGADKQQHTFTISSESGGIILIKGRNLYKNGVYRKKWNDEKDRLSVLNEKHERGNISRNEREIRKASYIEFEQAY